MYILYYSPQSTCHLVLVFHSKARKALVGTAMLWNAQEVYFIASDEVAGCCSKTFSQEEVFAMFDEIVHHQLLSDLLMVLHSALSWPASQIVRCPEMS